MPDTSRSVSAPPDSSHLGRTALDGLRNSVVCRGARTYRVGSDRPGLAVGGTVDPARFQAGDEPYPGHWRTPPAAWPTDPATDDAALEALRQGLAELPAAWYAVVVARDGEGRTAAELAASAHVSSAEQQVILHRARAFLRERLDRFYAGSATS